MKSIVIPGLLAGLVLIAASPLAFGDHPERPLGDSRFLASVPFPGYPEGVAVHEGRIYVSGPAAFGVNSAATVFVYDLETSALLDTIKIANEPFFGGGSCIAFRDDNLYMLVESLGVVKINIKTKAQSLYSGPFPFIFHSAFSPGPELLNDLAFDKDGYLYVTDSFQATIWRVPPGGGAPAVWLQDPHLDGFIGLNGMRVDKESKYLYFTQSMTGGIFQTPGALYKVPLKAHPVFADVQLLHTFTPSEIPDGIAFGKSGKLYVCLAGTSQIAVLSSAGTELARYSGPAGSLPWVNPANIAFDGENGRLIVTNHASLLPVVDPSLFAIFDVFVDDKAGKLFDGE